MKICGRAILPALLEKISILDAIDELDGVTGPTGFSDHRSEFEVSGFPIAFYLWKLTE